MKSIELHVESFDRDLESYIVEKDSYATGETYEVNIGTITLQPKLIMEAVGVPDVIDAVIRIGEGVTIVMLGNWLWGKLSDRRIKRLTINRTEVRIEKDEIIQILKETLSSEE